LQQRTYWIDIGRGFAPRQYHRVMFWILDFSSLPVLSLVQWANYC